MTHLRIIAPALALLALLVADDPAAQEFPAREIHVVCGYPPGTGADTMVRYFSERVRPLAGKPLVVDNKPGAFTSLAAEVAKNAKPDGYTVFITAGNSTMASNPHLFKQLKYDPMKDFAPVTTLVKAPFVLGVGPNSPVNSVAELNALLKTKGDKASYGYSSAIAMISAELYQSIVGTKAVGIAYKGTPDVMPDLISGQLDFNISDAIFLLGQARGGRFKPLVMTSAQRSLVAPELPGMSEAGIPGYDLYAWIAVWVPAGVPQPIVAKLEGWFNQVVTAPETKAELFKMGGEPMPGNARSLAELTRSEHEKWGRLIRLAKIEPQ